MTLPCLTLLAVARMVFPAGDAAHPSAVAPLSPTTAPVAFWWDAAAFHAGERVFPWADLHAAPTNGARFSIDFGVVDPTGFDRTPVTLEGTIDTTVSRYLLDRSLGAIGNSPISNVVTFVAAKDGTACCALGTSCAAPNYVNCRNRVNVKKGDVALVALVDKGPSSGTAYFIVFDADDRLICLVGGPFRDPKLGFDFRYLWTDLGAPSPVLHLVTDVWQDAPGCTIRLTSFDLLTGKPLAWTKTIAVAPAWGVQDYAVDVADLPPGVYRFKVEYRDPAGKCVHEDTARYYSPGTQKRDGKPLPRGAPWDDTQLGAEDVVPPPWTPPVFGADTFACWNRNVKFGGAGLVSSIVSAGEEVLAEPVAVLLNGKPLAFDVAGVNRKKSEATYRLKARDAAVSADVRCEFDGYMRFALTYPASVTSLAWRVAGRTNAVNAVEGCSDGAAPGGVRHFRVDKKPAWWMLGPRVGLMGGTLNLHGCHAKDLDKTGRVETTPDGIAVTTTFVDCPMAPGPACTVLFYLEPTPVKPKDNALSSVMQDDLVLWTGHVYREFETKFPGFELKDDFARFRNALDEGKRVFYYCATKGASPESPFWSRYQQDWNAQGLGSYAREVPIPLAERERGNWTFACVNSKNFRESKIWGVDWMLNHSEPKMKDLYFDLAGFDLPCENAFHGCRWTDDFGRVMQDLPMENVREIHKRCYRLVKAKNPDGALYGHVDPTRFPGEVFFDALSMGEALALQTFRHGRVFAGTLMPTYYDVFTPELMQMKYVSHGREKTVYVPPQFHRALAAFGGNAAAAAYNPDTPEAQTCFKHFTAYLKIHDLNVDRGAPTSPEMRIFYLGDGAVRALGGKRIHHAYYLPGDDEVTLSAPGPRQLWAFYETPSAAVLIVLNDTDKRVSQTVSVKGLSAHGFAKGVDVLDETVYDFASGRFTFDLGPRESRFVRFVQTPPSR